MQQLSEMFPETVGPFYCFYSLKLIYKKICVALKKSPRAIVIIYLFIIYICCYRSYSILLVITQKKTH